jgi:hypothetical protein
MPFLTGSPSRQNRPGMVEVAALRRVRQSSTRKGTGVNRSLFRIEGGEADAFARVLALPSYISIPDGPSGPPFPFLARPGRTLKRLDFASRSGDRLRPWGGRTRTAESGGELSL